MRAHYIKEVARLVIETAHPETYNFIEIGCMFKEDEGLSTYNIAKLIVENNINARFVSIDNNPEHIDAARSLLDKYDKHLLNTVEFHCGDSREVLPLLIEKMGEVHFALLDGSGHPELCLEEFEIITKALSDDCACILDDIVEFAPTKYYDSARPFGKGTLIYPVLIIAQYLHYKHLIKTKDKPLTGFEIPYRTNNKSEIIPSLDEDKFIKILSNNKFRILGMPGARHGMLVFGSTDIVDNVQPFILPFSSRSNIFQRSIQLLKNRLLRMIK